MEYAAGGDMFEYVVRKGGLRESEARWFFQQLIVAVDYIHRMVRRSAWEHLWAAVRLLRGAGGGRGPPRASSICGWHGSICSWRGGQRS